MPHGVFERKKKYKVQYREPGTDREWRTEEFTNQTKAVNRAKDLRKQGYETGFMRFVKGLWKKIF